jgi:dGTPase
MPPARAPYAADAMQSRGRKHAEPESPTRTPFARDRDRIIHCTAFRRLKEKTQVFVAHEGDHYRTRLTHSLEVAQIARSLARSLGLDDDLAEAIALAHDLGHPPFAHAGEEELQACMAPYGGFDHNVQTFRIVTRLEKRYPAFEGLNLTWETLEGVVKHNGPITQKLDEPAFRAIQDYSIAYDLELSTHASAEAQVAALSDDIAYHSHDLDDGMRFGLFGPDELAHLPITREALAEAGRLSFDMPLKRLRHETIRRVINTLISDLVEETRARLKKLEPQTPDDIRRAKKPVVGFSPAIAEANYAIKEFLRARMYRHWRVNRMTVKARRLTEELFSILHADPSLLPDGWRAQAGEGQPAQAAGVVCDYVAGMTDRFAQEEYKRLTNIAMPG